MVIVLEIEIIKGKETVIWRMTFLGMATIIGMVSVLGIALVLRIGNFLVMVRAVSWTQWFNELYVHKKNLGQTDKQTDTTVYRVAPQLVSRFL